MTSLEDNINKYRNEMMKNIEKNITQIRENHSISLRLIAEGLHDHEICSARWDYWIDDRRSLSKLRLILGRLELYSKQPVSPTKISVSLCVKDKYNGFRIHYVQDFVSGGRCKIERKELTLVCKR